MTSMRRRSSRGKAAALLLVAPFAAQAAPQSGSDWDWLVAPYVWAASIGTDVRTVTPPSNASNDVAFDDVLDKLDGVFEVHGEGQGDAFGVLADFTYFGLADEDDHRFLRTESDLDLRLFELAAVWSPGPERFTGLETFAGARIIDLDTTIQFIPYNPAFSGRPLKLGDTFYDVMIGARYTWALSDRWTLTLRGDGSWGDTEGTWNASVVGQYRTRNGGWVFGYKYFDVDLEQGGESLSVSLDGPVIGYAFRF
jgi:hypothetical protein